MKIYNENKTQEIQEFDEKLYHLVEDKILVAHHDATPEIQKQSHYETIAVYENGGKDVEEIIDVPYQPAHEAYDEYEDILRIVKFTNKELAEFELVELKTWFDVYYMQHEQKYRRLHTMKKLCDDGTDPMTKLLELYEEAETKRTRIQELERVVEENGTLHNNII